MPSVAIYHPKTNRKFVGDTLLLVTVGNYVNNRFVETGRVPVNAKKITVADIHLPDEQFDAFRAMYDDNGKLKPEYKFHGDWYYYPIKKVKKKV